MIGRAGALMIALLAAAGVRSEVLPAKGAVDARVRTVEYRPEQVYRLPGYVGYQVHLEFEPGETFVGLGSGDVEALSFAAQGRHLFLKPKAATVATNVTVLTNRRQYQFEYSASARRPNPAVDDVIYSLRFTYPPTASAIGPALARDARPRNFDYAFCGPRGLQPVRAFDDGVQTTLVFPPRADLPAIFVGNPDGTEGLVNVTIEADAVRVHRVAERLILRRGRQAGCIVNRAYSGGGERLSSGTLAPEVVRRTREGEP